MNDNLPITTAEEPHIRSKMRTLRRRKVFVAALSVALIAAAAVTLAVGKDTFLSALFGGEKTVAEAGNAPAAEAKGIYGFDFSAVPEGCAAVMPVDLSGAGEKADAVAPVKAAGKVIVIAAHPYESYTGEITAYAPSDFSATGGEYTTAKVAAFLASELRRLGIDAEYLDDGAQSGCGSSAAAAEKLCEYMKNTAVATVIDVRRGALADGNGNILRPITSGGDGTVAQTARVAAAGGERYGERLGNAAALAEKMNAICEKSALVESRDGVLNQDTDAVFFTAEIGAAGNSYAEAIRAATLLAAAYAAMMGE